MPLKVELHSHTSDDPFDAIPYTATDLIDRAALLGYHALAITLHDKEFDVAPLLDYASARGVLLIRGVERTIQGKHVLLINFANDTGHINTFEELAELKRRDRGLVIAPHPYYPLSTCLGDLLDRYPEVIDAVEVHGLYARGTRFNAPAVEWAARHGKPLVGNGDVHRLTQLGATYSLVDAEANPQSICDAIRAGRVEVHTRPLGWFHAARLVGDLFATAAWVACRKLWRSELT